MLRRVRYDLLIAADEDAILTVPKALSGYEVEIEALVVDLSTMAGVMQLVHRVGNRSVDVLMPMPAGVCGMRSPTHCEKSSHTHGGHGDVFDAGNKLRAGASHVVPPTTPAKQSRQNAAPGSGVRR